MLNESDTLTDIWKANNLSILKKIFSDSEISEDKLNNLLDNIIKKYKRDNSFILRNLYKQSYDEISINDLPKLIKEKKLAIGANGSLMISPDERVAITSEFLKDNIRDKDIYKEKAKKAQSEGDLFNWKLNQDTSDTRKGFINSTYGIQAQRGSIFYNPDTASLITTQARTIITEMIWGLERMFSSNVVLTDMNELFLYIDNIIKKDIDESLFSYISYIPLDKDIETKISVYINLIENKNDIDDLKIHLFKYIKNLSKKEKIKLYYSDNFITLILKNPKIQKLFLNILDKNIDFITTDIDDSRFPIVIKKELDLLSKISLEFGYSNTFVHDRIEKYKKSKRNVIVVSDTDSVMINIGNIIDQLNPIWSKYEDNNKMIYKKVNTLVYIMIELTNIIGDRIISNSMIDDSMKEFLIMKNEYLFKRLIVFNTKKNYIGHEILREGKIVDDVSITGLKLSGSNLHPRVKVFIDEIIKDYVIRTKNINPIFVLNKIKELENDFKNDILIRKDSIAGTRTSYSFKQYDNPYLLGHVRGVYIWNILYPNNKIMPGDVFYTFVTKGRFLENFSNLKSVDPDMYSKLKNEIFNDEKLAHYGLSMISIPEITEDFTAIPDWIVDIIDIWKVINKHMQPLYSFMTSINLQINTISSQEISASNILLL